MARIERQTKRYPTDLTDEEWERIGPLLPRRCAADRLIRAIRDDVQDTVNQAGQQIVQRQLQVAPTLTIRPGFPFRILLGLDLIFENARG